MTDRASDLVEMLTDYERAVLRDLSRPGCPPWRIGSADEFNDHWARRKFYDMGLLTSVAIEAVQGDSGRQFWLFNPLGMAVAALASKGDAAIRTLEAEVRKASLEASHQRKCAVEWFDRATAAEAQLREATKAFEMVRQCLRDDGSSASYRAMNAMIKALSPKAPS